MSSVTERLVAWVREQKTAGVPAHAVHEAKRLLINQLKASVGAIDHPSVTLLHAWAADNGKGDFSVIWLGDKLGAEGACVVNAALYEVLDFNETHIPTFQHAVSGVLPAVLAAAEKYGSSGQETLEALALGIEVELAVASILIPDAYTVRGFVPGGITGPIGGAVGCGLLAGLDDVRMRDAIGLAMNSAAGFYQSAGSNALPYLMGMAARAGYTAADLAGRGLDAPAKAFEGDKGMFQAYSNEPREKIETVLGALGDPWRIMNQSYKTVPTETITHGPIECALALLAQSGGRTVQRLKFKVCPMVVSIAEERASRFGTPSNELEARFDLKHCAAAAWVRGRFTLNEMREGAYTDPAILDLRSRTDLIADPEQKTFDGAGLEVVYTDGSGDEIFIPNFLGTPGNPMTDDELSAVFTLSAEDVLSPEHAKAVLDAAWGLNNASDVRGLMTLLVKG